MYDPLEKRKTLMEQVLSEVEGEGFAPGSELFEKRARQVRAGKCREVRRLYSCNQCVQYDYCEVIKQVMRDGLEP